MKTLFAVAAVAVLLTTALALQKVDSIPATVAVYGEDIAPVSSKTAAVFPHTPSKNYADVAETSEDALPTTDRKRKRCRWYWKYCKKCYYGYYKYCKWHHCVYRKKYKCYYYHCKKYHYCYY